MNSEHFSAYSSLIYPKLRLKLEISNNFNEIERPFCSFPGLFKPFCFIFLILFTQILSQTAFAVNYDKEAKINRALEETINPAEIIWLETASPRKTMALFKQSEGVNKLGSIIILADLNNHSDWPIIISPLRNKLPLFGWETLSIQMPLKQGDLLPPELEDLYKTAEMRLGAAIKYLKTQGSEQITIIGHRYSVAIAIRYLIENKEDIDNIEALIGISGFDTAWINSSLLLRQLPIAFLDIFAQNDSTDTLKAAPKRLVSAKFAGQLNNKKAISSLSEKVRQLAINKTGNPHYRQVEINAADKHFSRHQDILLKTIRGWLKNHENNQENNNDKAGM